MAVGVSGSGVGCGEEKGEMKGWKIHDGIGWVMRCAFDDDDDVGNESGVVSMCRIVFLEKPWTWEGVL